MSGVNAHRTRRLAHEASHLVASLANYPFGIDGKHIVIIRASPEKVSSVTSSCSSLDSACVAELAIAIILMRFSTLAVLCELFLPYCKI